MKPNDTLHVDRDENRDPISGEPGAHPVGVGIGTAAGGAAAGAAAGMVGGPIGTAIGAVVGGVAGAIAGKAVAEAIDPTAEDAYWRENYKTRPYVKERATYDEYRPAYEHGWNSNYRLEGRKFSDVERDLESSWRKDSKLSWDHAKHAVRDAYERKIVPGMKDEYPIG